MNERDALFAHVCAHPDDDLPRLVLADWLDEHGEPERAEFIRLQIERAAQGLPGLGERERQLLERHEAEWGRWFREDAHHAILPGNGRGWKDQGWEYRRGFVDEVECWTVAHFLAIAEDLFSQAPVRHLYVHGETGWQELAASPYLARLHTLEIDRARCDFQDRIDLMRSPHVRGLRSLMLRGVGLEDLDLRYLAGTTNLSALVDLDLGNDRTGAGLNFLTLDGIRELATSAEWSFLQTLRLDGTRLDGPTLAALANGLMSVSLRTLDLTAAGLIDAELPSLLGDRFEHLMYLGLAENALEDASVRRLIEWPRFQSLLSLDLRENRINDPGASHLLEAAPANLRSLDLAGNPIGPEMMAEFQKRFPWP